MRLKIYSYEHCGTCKKALKFLDAHRIPYETLPIREHPPSKAELKRMLGYMGGDVRKLFNTSGGDYKALGLGQKLGSMTQADALKLLASNGNLVKRPFVLGDDVGAVGFREDLWKELFL